MNVGGLIGGLIAGCLGAALWAGLAYYGNIEIAILAWGIGLFVGIGVSAGSNTGGIVPAIVAVLITAASLIGGKYLAVQMAVREFDQQAHSGEYEIDDETLTVQFAYDIAEEKIAAGDRFSFRNGRKTIDDVEDINDFPREIVDAAKEKLESLPPAEHDALIAAKKAEFEQFLGQIEGAIAQEGFMQSFSPMDILFFLLGIFTAGKVALSDYVDD